MPALRADPAEWISPRGELQVIAQVTRLPRRSIWSTLHCASAGIGLAASMHAVRVIGAFPPATGPAGADWTAPGSCICVVNSHFPDLISPAACAAMDTAAARDRASKLPPATLVIASGLLDILKANKDGCTCIPKTRKTRRHRVRRGIKGPSVDAIGMRPAKANRICT